jgi:hypothetical protein
VAIRSENFTIVGDSDIYGLGVSVGLYLQWLSGFVLRNIGSWYTVARVRTVNNALCAALALAAAINVVDGKALSINYLISYHLTVILSTPNRITSVLKLGQRLFKQTVRIQNPIAVFASVEHWKTTSKRPREHLLYSCPGSLSDFPKPLFYLTDSLTVGYTFLF